jgi:hypothetical protein
MVRSITVRFPVLFGPGLRAVILLRPTDCHAARLLLDDDARAKGSGEGEEFGSSEVREAPHLD